MRRLDRRMRFNERDSLAEYVELLESEDDEAQALFRDLLISVSGFFRDPDAYGMLERDVIPRLFEGKGPDDTVRAWIAGCATGEEVYSLAMLLSEHAAALHAPSAIQLFATDIDEQACGVAREALYPETISAVVSPQRLDRFFDRENAGYRVRKPLRKLVMFATHDLLKDPPFSRLDLVTCRSVLIYLEPLAQRRVLESFHYALRADGFLFLGTSESVGGDDLFRPLNATLRVFQPMPLAQVIVPQLSKSDPLRPAARPATQRDVYREPRAFSFGALHLRMLEAWAPPSLIVNERFDVVHLSEGAGRFLRLAGGEPSANLLSLAPGDLGQKLRIALYQALQKGESSQRSVRIEIGSEARLVDLHVRPVEETEGGGGRFALVVFDELPGAVGGGATPRPATGGADERSATSELEDDLRRTREQLESTLRDREVTIEELQSANEELQSINEEHKATTEEMETSREELQSLNEQLTTINQEHRGTIDELQQVNSDLRNLMAATDIGTLFLDRGLRIRRFTPSLVRLFNLVPSDQGRLLAHVTHRLRYDTLAADAERVISSLETIEREVADDAGAWFNARIMPYRTPDDRIDGAVLTFYDVTAQKHLELAERSAKEVAEAERARVAALMEQVPAAVIVIDAPSGRILTANKRATEFWDGALPAAATIVDYTDYFDGRHPDGTRYRAEQWPMARAMSRGEVVRDEEILLIFGDGQQRSMLVSAVPTRDAAGEIDACIVCMIDITGQNQLEDELRAAKTTAEAAGRAKEQFVATLSHELRTPLNGILGYADLLLFDENLDDVQRRNIGRIKTSVWHLSHMIDEILVLATMDRDNEALERRRIDARDVAREAASMIEPEVATKQLGFSLKLPDERLDLETDSVKACQILVNLLGNAVKYTERGEIGLELRADAGEAVFVVRDSGIGIAASDVERVFERFWQASDGLTRTAGGAGLGLAVVREFSRMLGGDVTVESTLGSGSAFTLRLPLAGKPEAPEVASTA
jgi:two-component system CheB/CheR fusion protein